MPHPKAGHSTDNRKSSSKYKSIPLRPIRYKFTPIEALQIDLDHAECEVKHLKREVKELQFDLVAVHRENKRLRLENKDLYNKASSSFDKPRARTPLVESEWEELH